MPSPEKEKLQGAMLSPGIPFFKAIKAIVDGDAVTRLGWMNNDVCKLRDGWLMIQREGVWHRWLINDGDMTSNDWMIANPTIKPSSQ